MKRWYELSVAVALVAIVGVALSNAAGSAPSTSQYNVLIDPSAATQFGSNEALMRYAYTVIPNTGAAKSAIEGEGTFNFKNALENQSTSLSAFSQLHQNKMADIIINTSTITVGDSIYTALTGNVTIKAAGYPYTIAHDKDKDQFQIRNKDAAIIMSFTRPAQPAEAPKAAEQKAPEEKK